ncbi:MAG: hypothetical protein AMXMBFR33_09250 [Candidatus Xenobia bacterium]
MLLAMGCSGSETLTGGPPVVDNLPPQALLPPAAPLTLESRPNLGRMPVIAELGEIPPAPLPPNAPPPAGATFTPLGTLRGGDSEAYAISADGSTLTGASIDPAGNRDAFVWTRASGMQALPNSPRKPQSEGHALNSNGSKVGGLGILFDILAAQTWTDQGVFTLPGSVAPNLPPQVVSDLSLDGTVAVGTAGTGFLGYQGFRWIQGAPQPHGLGTLGAPPGQQPGSEGHGSSGDGSVITGISTNKAGGLSAYRWVAGTMSALPTLGNLAFSDGWEVSADGSSIVGWSSNQPNLVPAQATLWNASGAVSLGTLAGFEFSSQAYGASSDGSVVVGAAASGQNFHSQAAFVWDQANGMRRLQDLLGSAVPAGWNLLVATAVSDDGQTVAGFGLNPQGAVEAFSAQLP